MTKYRFLLLMLTVCACSGGGGEKGEVGADVAVDLSDGHIPDVTGDGRGGELVIDVEAEDGVASLPALPPDKVFSTRYGAGAASAPANPADAVGRHLAGFGFCAGKPEACRVSEGQHDDMMVSAAALADPENQEVVIFVGIDSVGLIKYDVIDAQQRVVAAFKEQLGIAIDGHRVVIGASHTHGGIDTVGLWDPLLSGVREEEAYIEHLKQVIVDVSVQAFDNLDDVELEWGTSQAPNHDEDLADDDETVWVLRGHSDGATVFTLTRWVGHPTVYGGGNNGISADWVGPFRETMVKETGGVAVYLNGPIGSVYTEYSGECTLSDFFPEGFQDPDMGPEDHARVACVGVQVAQAALAALSQAQPLADSGIVHRYAEFEFHPTNILLAAILGMSAVPWELVDPADSEAMVTSRFSWTTVGELDYLTTPGETFVSMALKAVGILADAGHPNAIIIGVSQDWFGYVLTAEQWPQENLSYYRGLSPGPHVEPAYMKRLKELAGVE